MKNKLFYVIFTVFLCFTSIAKANVCVQEELNYENSCTEFIDYCQDRFIRSAIQNIILEEMTVWTHPNTGEITYSTSCRNQTDGCEAHIEKVIKIIFEKACNSTFDPYVILAIAKHESNYNPFILNKQSGAVGLLQIMPRSPFVRGIRYVHSEQYRENCRSHETYCQEEVIEASFKLLTRSLERCGSMNGALGLYGSGSCRGSRRFVRFVNSYSANIRLESIIRSEWLRSENGSTNI